MACSKIFSGNLPELTNEIIKYLEKDISTLYSCILVNRLLCRLAIPLLWEDPFSAPTQNYHCIKIYLHFLNRVNKAKFSVYGINYNLTNTLFNYPSFIKYLDTSKICSSIVYWVGTLMNEYNERLGNLIFRSLFEMFIENEGNLHSLEVVPTSRMSYKYLSDNIDVLQNPNLTCDIKNLTLDFFDISSQNIILLLKFLSSNCKSISSFIIKFPRYDRNNDHLLIEKYLLQIIISQNNLKKVLFGGHANIYSPFLSLKTFNVSNTLNTIIFYYIDFKNIVSILREVFDQLNVLESIHILYCHSLNLVFVQQIIKVIKPFKLRSLFMNEVLYIESLQLLLEKFSDCLENFGLGDRFTGMKYNELIPAKRQLFEFIMKNCKKIRYFDPDIPDDNNIYLIIKNNQCNINYLTIKADFHVDYLSSNVLQNLGQVLPSRLEYLCLSLTFKTNDLEIFLKNSQNTFINKLLIGNMAPEKDEKILFCIKKYIMRKERVKYLAILETVGYNMNEDELFLLKDEVNEFRLHNIIVLPYDDLYISNTYNYIIDNYLEF